MSRTILSHDNLHPTIKDKVAGFHHATIAELRDAVAQHRIVVVGMRYNDAVWKARKVLTKAGLDFHYLEYGSYTSQWRRRLALKMWSGWPTFPMVFVDQALIGGASDLIALLNAGQITLQKNILTKHA